MNEIDEKILNNLAIPINYVDDLEVIVKDCKKRFGKIDIGYLAASCFSYGIVVGKRQDRKRRKLENAI